MSSFDVFAMAVRSLFKRKIRTILTVMGVIIGCSAITVMMSLGIAINMNFDEQIEAMGDQALFIDVWIDTWSGDPNVRTFHREDIDYLNSLSNVRIATELINTNIVLTNGRYANQWSRVIGIRTEAFEFLGVPVAEGRALQDGDEFHMVFGSQVINDFMNWSIPNPWMFHTGEAPFEPVGVNMQGTFSMNAEDQARVRPYTIEVVGLLEDDPNWRTNWNIYMDIETVRQIERDRQRFMAGMTGGNNPGFGNQTPDGYSEVIIMADDFTEVENVAQLLRDMGFENVWTNTSWIEFQRESTQALQNLLTAIGAVSLFIAAIGIANTMIMSIYERTKEIGVMKVIGASLKDIRKLFLVEAGMIGALGGLFGVALSAAVSYMFNNAQVDIIPTTGGVISFIPMWLYGAAFVFSCVIGVVSGFFPARRATRISALTAIKTD